MKRFVALQEPTCTWAVFDSFDDVPAEFGGVVLVGLERAEAMRYAMAANAADSAQMAAQSELTQDLFPRRRQRR